MSNPLGYLMQAVKNRITSNVIPALNASASSKNAACEITDDGRPTVPYQGLVFFGIHNGQYRSNNQTSGRYYQDSYCNFSITVSVKSAHISRYRFGDVVIADAATGLEMISDLAVVALTGYLSLSEETNTLMAVDFPSDQTFLFGEPPVFLGSSRVVPRSAEWFGAKPAADDSNRPMGLSQELSFQGLRLIRPVGQA